MQRSHKWLKAPDESLLNPETPLVVTVCDEDYFPYAYALAKSIEYFDKRARICIHVINPSKQLLHRLKEIVQGAAHIFSSYEIIDLASLADEQKKTYYASARFLLICDLLNKVESPLLCLDADSLVVNPIDNDFNTNDNADIYLARRDMRGQESLHLKVATGTIYIRNSIGSKKFFNHLKEEVISRFDVGNLPWFTDQIIFSEAIGRIKAAKVRNIKTKYADWNFSDNSIIWAGKGERKSLDLNFLIMQNLLRDDNQSKRLLELTAKLTGKNALVATKTYQKVKATVFDNKQTALIILPRLDLPWKEPKDLNMPPIVSMQTLELRIYWKKFTIQLTNALSSVGFHTELLEVPAWEINDSIFDRTLADVIFIPHKCRREFSPNTIDRPVYFYMQEFFSWVFTVDPRGWSAASSVYPVNYADLPETSIDKYSEYKKLLSTNKLESKFLQPDQGNINDLVSSGQIPGHTDAQDQYRDFIFFPLQISNDQSILYFSAHSEEVVIDSLLCWSKENNIPIVFKPHPASPKNMQPLVTKIMANGGYISNANIHELIELSSAVYTINSGVGFEALFHNKPIVTFGRVEYDCCTFNANPENLDLAWIYCSQIESTTLQKKYANFVNWFMSDYAYDISDYSHSTMRLRLLAKRIKKKFFSSGDHVDAEGK